MNWRERERGGGESNMTYKLYQVVISLFQGMNAGDGFLRRRVGIPNVPTFSFPLISFHHLAIHLCIERYEGNSYSCDREWVSGNLLSVHPALH